MTDNFVVPEHHKEFWEWREKHPNVGGGMMRWGDHHTEVAVAFAKYMASKAVNQTLDEALNSGDGSYRP